MAYDRFKGPDPRYFKQILENSLKKQEVQLFCEDFMNLLRYNQKTHKQKVNYKCVFTLLPISHDIQTDCLSVLLKVMSITQPNYN